ANALHDVALDGFCEPVGVDDLAAIVRDGEFARPNPAAAPVDINLGNNRHSGSIALGIGHAAAGRRVASLILARRRTRLPARLLSRRLNDGDVARVLHMSQTQLYRVNLEGCRDLVDERFAREVYLGPDRIAQMG